MNKDEIKALRKGSRESLLGLSLMVNKPHRNKKLYNRKQKHRKEKIVRESAPCAVVGVQDSPHAFLSQTKCPDCVRPCPR